MIYFLALIPATGLTIAGYFVLYLSARSEGTLRSFGKYLGFWAFTLAGLLVLGAIFAAAHRGPHGYMRGMHEHMYGPMYGPWHADPHFSGQRDGQPGSEARPGLPAPGAPNPPPPAGPAPPPR